MKKLVLTLASLAMAACAAQATDYSVYYGMLHSHTNISDGSDNPAEADKYARDTAGLDIFSIADHDYYPNDMTTSDWATIKNAANSYNQDGVFATFWGFEWTSDDTSYHAGLQNKGHITIINSLDMKVSGTNGTCIQGVNS